MGTCTQEKYQSSSQSTLAIWCTSWSTFNKEISEHNHVGKEVFVLTCY